MRIVHYVKKKTIRTFNFAISFFADSPFSTYHICTPFNLKGQLISKGLFGILNSSKKLMKKFNLTTMIPQIDLISFIIWRLKRHFEISWPLGAAHEIFFSALWVWFGVFCQNDLVRGSLSLTMILTDYWIKSYNLFVTSKNETTNSPIHQFTNLKCCKMSLKWKRNASIFSKVINKK